MTGQDDSTPPGPSAAGTAFPVPPLTHAMQPLAAEVGTWSSQDDNRLMVAVTNRSPDAFAELHQRHSAAMAATVGRMGLASEADDVVQVVFLGLWQRPHRFDPGRGPLRSFLMMQARGRAIDVWRGEQARHTRERTEPGGRPHPSPAAEEPALTRIHTERSLDLLDCLPRDERDAIALAFFGGHTYHEVATLLGKPEGTIKSRIRSGLHRLNQELAD